MSSRFTFDRYYRYDELVATLRQLVAEFPNLARIDCIGQSHEGREILLVEVTAQESGPASDKPAFWCDGNIHASEVSASTAVLYLLQKLLTQYGKDEEITHILDTRAFYLVPRLNPDGAEWSLESPPRVVRSSTRPYPYNEDDIEGLERQDLDGDGRILSIRMPDPNGAWKIAEDEPRLLTRREPGERGGSYYRLLPEGLFHNFDPNTLRGYRIKEGLDMNRNFPSAWRMENEQYGAGPFPTSEPEIRACVQAIVERPNICGAITFHTFSGVHLRPPSRMPDDEIPAEDLWVYKTLGAEGEKITGYPAISNYHEFRYHPKEVITGVFDDWMYEHRGVFAWTTEIWSPQRQAGITDYKYIEWFRDHPFDDEKKLLAWSDNELDGLGYVDWHAFDHPQLGKVEIGGWDAHFAFRNPPPQFLEKEIAPLGDWAIWQLACSPLLAVRDVQVTKIDDSSSRVQFVVENQGYLPTNVSEIAKKRKICRGVVGEINKVTENQTTLGSDRPEWLIAGKLRSESGQLRGWSHITASGFGWMMNATEDRTTFEWVVAPGTYELVARHERAGTVRAQVTVK